MKFVSTPFTINRRAVITNIATLFSSAVISQGLTAILLLLLARHLGPELYGQYASTTAFAASTAVVFSLGLNVWLLREGGRLPGQIGTLLGSVFVNKLLIGLVWVLALYAISPLINRSTLPRGLLNIAAVAVFLNHLLSTTETAFKAILQNKINAALEFISIIAQLIVTLILINSGDLEAAHFIQARAVIYFIVLLASLVLAHYLIGFRPNWETARRAVLQSPPFAISEILVWMFMRVDLLIIALRLDEFSAGIYATSEGVINALFVVPNTVSFVILPVLSNLFQSNRRQAWLTSRRSILLLAAVGLGLFVTIFVGAELLPLIVGNAYDDSRKVLQILSPIIIFHSINFGLAPILVVTNQQTKRTWVQFFAVVLNVVVNLLIIDTAGVVGVAYVYVLTEIALSCGYAWLVFRYWRKHSSLGE